MSRGRLPLGSLFSRGSRDEVTDALGASRGVSQNKELEDLFISPFAVPKPPQRFYYLFGTPIETSRADLDDPDRVGQLYRQVCASSAPVTYHS